jgi:hypothetical protein
MDFKVLKPISDFPNETPKFEATSRNLSGDLGEDDDDEEGDCEEEDEDEEVVTLSKTFYGNPKPRSFQSLVELWASQNVITIAE